MLKHSILASLALVMLSVVPASAQSTYTIPDDLTPVSEWADGFTAAEAEKFRKAYGAADFSKGNDITAFAYLNITEVLPNVLIGRGPGPVSELKSDPMPEIADVVATTDLGTMPLSEAMADPRSRMQAFMVLHEGKIVYETYPGMPSDSKHMWASSSKTITGLLIHMLASEGLVDLNAPVSKYLAFTKGSPFGDSKVEDVLHMRTGLNYEETHANINNPEHPIAQAFGAALTARGVPAGPGMRDLVVNVKRHRPPNTAFEYSTYNTQMLGDIVENVTGMPWNRVVSERIWKNAGMDGDALLAISAAGEPLTGGLFSSTLRDFGRFGLLFTPSWNVVAKQPVVPGDYLESVYAAVNPAIYLEAFQGPRMVKAFGADDAPKGQSYQWDAIFADGDLYKAGLGGQALYVSPETDTVVVYFSTTWQNSLSMSSYARAIVKQYFRKN